MQVINFSDARNQLKQVIDQVVADCDVTIISRRDAEDAVVMSLDTYNTMMETFKESLNKSQEFSNSWDH